MKKLWGRIDPGLRNILSMVGMLVACFIVEVLFMVFLWWAAGLSACDLLK